MQDFLRLLVDSELGRYACVYPSESISAWSERVERRGNYLRYLSKAVDSVRESTAAFWVYVPWTRLAN